MKYLKSYKLFEKQVTELNYSNQELTELPPLPKTLQNLWCHNNKLQELPPLPSTLQRLYCENNNLQKLPPLPSSLQRLDCDNNNLQELPPLPKSLEVLWCKGNPLKEPLPVWCHERFGLDDLYNKDLQKDFGSYVFQKEYLQNQPENFNRLEVFGYDSKIKEEFPYIFQSKRTGII
jgi:Leucine-rich repeat (LRR) protein